MPNIEPFRAVRFDVKAVKGLSKVVCPPYDVINKQQRQEYLKKSRYNAVSLVLPKGKTKLIRCKNSKRLLDKWLESGVLFFDLRPSVYVYLQRYKIGKITKSRLGFISLLEIENNIGKKVLPHEKIFNKFKFERFNLMKTTQAHLCPIFTIFNDEGNKVEKIIFQAVKNKKPIIDITAEGVREILWKISDNGYINDLRASLKNKRIFIADGHHRFEASVFLRDYLRQKERPAKESKMPYDYTMAYFLSMQDRGLLILPTHRAVKKLPLNFSKDFMLKRLSKDFLVCICKNKEGMLKKLRKADAKKKHGFGFYYKNLFIFVLLKNDKIIKNIGARSNCLSWRRLDVSILHYFILPKVLKIKEKVNRKRNIYYYRGKSEAIKMVKAGKFKMAIFLNPTKAEEVEAVAKSGNRMPHKSTYFYPKLLTGLVIHKF